MSSPGATRYENNSPGGSGGIQTRNRKRHQRRRRKSVAPNDGSSSPITTKQVSTPTSPCTPATSSQTPSTSTNTTPTTTTTPTVSPFRIQMPSVECTSGVLGSGGLYAYLMESNGSGKNRKKKEMRKRMAAFRTPDRLHAMNGSYIAVPAQLNRTSSKPDFSPDLPAFKCFPPPISPTSEEQQRRGSGICFFSLLLEPFLRSFLTFMDRVEGREAACSFSIFRLLCKV